MMVNDVVYLDREIAYPDRADCGLVISSRIIKGQTFVRVILTNTDTAWFAASDVLTLASAIKTARTVRPAPTDSDYSRGWDDALTNLSAILGGN